MTARPGADLWGDRPRLEPYRHSTDGSRQWAVRYADTKQQAGVPVLADLHGDRFTMTAYFFCKKRDAREAIDQFEAAVLRALEKQAAGDADPRPVQAVEVPG